MPAWPNKLLRVLTWAGDPEEGEPVLVDPDDFGGRSIDADADSVDGKEPASESGGTLAEIDQSHTWSEPQTFNGALDGDGVDDIKGWVLIEAQSITSPVAQADFTTGIDSSFDEYVLVGRGVIPASDDVYLQFRIQESGGFKSANYRWATHGVDQSGSTNATGAASDSDIRLSEGGTARAWGSAAGEGGAFSLRLYSPAKTDWLKVLEAEASYNGAGGRIHRQWTSASYTANTNAITGLRVFFATGNIEEAELALYGVRS